MTGHNQTQTIRPDPIQKTHHIRLISGGSYTALDWEHDYHHSFTLYRGLCPIPTRSDFITFWRLENCHAAMRPKAQTHFLVVWPGDHYMTLLRIP
jgi:hypothetical protein